MCHFITQLSKSIKLASDVVLQIWIADKADQGRKQDIYSAVSNIGNTWMLEERADEGGRRAISASGAVMRSARRSSFYKGRRA